MAIKTLNIVADLETTTDTSDVRAWAVGAWDIDTNKEVFCGTSLHDFFNFLSNKNTKCFFHNLKFDGEYLLSYLLNNGFIYSETPVNNSFSALITEDGIFYQITVIFEKLNKKYKKVTFLDSLKKLPFKVSTISKAFNLSDDKLTIDYDVYRPIGHVLTHEEKNYLMNDCKIVANALKIQHDKGLTRMTNASDAMSFYKSLIGKSRFEKLFPVLPLELDSEIRRTYKGGFVYLNPKYKNYRGLKGVTLDINSLYPFVMKQNLLPYSHPIYFEGEPKPDKNYPLFIVKLRCIFELKKDHIPTIQLKNNRRFLETEYLTSSENEIVELYLTSVDLKLFLDHYEVYCLEYIEGYKFKGATGLFDDYINYWYHIKETEEGALKTLAKLMLNSLYGRFAMNPKSRRKTPYLDNNGVVRYEYTDVELRDPVYTIMGSFITSYAREKTIRSGQSVYNRFIYADTDSLHLIGYDLPSQLDIHHKNLGAWKNEGFFVDSMYVRAKTYMETMHVVKKDSLETYAKALCKFPLVWRESDGVHYYEQKVTCAGMPDNVKQLVTYDNFKSGSSFEGKLMPKRFSGGIVLVPTTFTIK